MTKEANIHFELYRQLSNAIEKTPEHGGIEFGSVIPEYKVGNKRADIVLLDANETPLLVIEAKREDTEGYDRNIDPYSPKVIEQAFGYAGSLGTEFFATYNGTYFVLWRTFEKGVPLLKRKSRGYIVKDLKVFAHEFLAHLGGIIRGSIGWEPDPRAFVNRLRVLHRRVAADMDAHLIKAKKPFRKKIEDWMNTQGWELESTAAFRRFSRQASFLLVNKLLLYKVLEDTGKKVPPIKMHELSVPELRRKAFQRIVKEVDFEAVYSHDPVFDEVPLSSKIYKEIREFLEELDNYNLGQFEYDTIGHIYEDIIPPEERHTLGQFYTPPEIVELISRLTIKKPDDVVFDPACGSGGFLIRAYNILKRYAEDSNKKTSHNKILSQIYGVDINRFPAHLTAINLALQDLKSDTEMVNLFVDDFFNIKPGLGSLFSERVDVRKPATSRDFGTHFAGRTKVDVVITNPPYIRQEKIKDKKKCRMHLAGVRGEYISERSDVYVYFFTHSLEFLKNDGRMGFITSDKWLTVDYGKGLQQFFLENFQIKAVVSFGKRVFDDPLVPTCVTMVQACESNDVRESNTVKFLRVNNMMNMEDIIGLVEDDIDAGTIIETNQYRLLAITQSELKYAEKWNRLLRAPGIYWEILENDKIAQLKDVASVSRGITTGANDFFYLTKEQVSRWKIEEEFVRLIVKSIKQAKDLNFTRNLTDLYILDLHSFVESILHSKNEISTFKILSSTLPESAKTSELSREETIVLNRLYEEGHKGVYNYIVHSMWEKDWGDENPPHRRSTCLSHRKRNGCWFDLGTLKTPSLFAAKGYWKRVFFPLNPDRVTIDCRLYEIHSDNELVLSGILNSSLSRLMRELHCRTTGGGMAEMMVYEFEEMPVLNPTLLTTEEKVRIKREVNNLINTGEIASIALDKAILAPLGMEEKAQDIIDALEIVSSQRQWTKEVESLVEGKLVSKKRITKMKGGELLRGGRQSKITEF